MTKRKIIILLSVAVIIIAAIAGLFYFRRSDQVNSLEKTKQDYPALASYIDDVIKWEDKLKENETRVESYATLGLIWKGLADQACNLKAPNCEKYYGDALKVYEKAVEITKRRNTLFLINAGNMARYLKDYAKTEDYYREAISVAPGDASLYLTLGELYEYDLKKTKEEIVALYEEGIKRMLDPRILEKAKEEYLERNK